MDRAHVVPFRAELIDDPSANGHGPRQILKLAGEIDLATAPAFEAALDQAFAGCSNIVVDIADVAFLGSTGIGELVRAMNRIQAADGTLLVRNPSPLARKVIALCGLEGLLLEDSQLLEA